MSKYTQGDPRRYTFTADNQNSEVFSGRSLIDPVRNKGGDLWAVATCERSGSGNYTVSFQVAIPAQDSNDLHWKTETTLNNGNQLREFRIYSSALYRFNSSGFANTVTEVDVRITSS